MENARRKSPVPGGICHGWGVASSKCLFCAIGKGEEAASVVLRDAKFCAFLDVRPVFKGHVLVVPLQHTPDLFALPHEDMGPFFETVRRVAAAVEQALGAQGSFVAINNKVSQSVPHLHAHAVPRSKGDGLRGFFWPRTKYDSEAERDEFRTRIVDRLARDQGQ